jgi:hypothetical protein
MKDKTWWHKTSNHLGGIYPYYDEKRPDFFTMEIEQLINHRKNNGEELILDIAGLTCKTCMPYLLGNRTLIEGIQRVPWMSNYEGNGKWVPQNLPTHQFDVPIKADLISSLKAALISEASSYINEANTVGILLSGGMDSRVVAGVLREIQLKTGYPKKVVAITWGKEESRDVVYAKRISDLFDWEFSHVPIGVDDLKDNIDIAGKLGAEYSPSHLHALPKIAKLKGIDLILAGSYGDMIGRAEFSGRHLTGLSPIFPDEFDRFSLIKNSVRELAIPKLKKDTAISLSFNKGGTATGNFEIEQAMHYMRRMLQSCMSVVTESTPLYQLFTSPKVFGLMWAIEPKLRDNSWYKLLLEQLPGSLLSIPWARTGIEYLSENGIEDKHSKSHHSYGFWLRNELKDTIVDRVNSDTIRNLGIFNDRSLDLALKSWGSAKTNSINSLDETMSWLASLYFFLENNELKFSHNYELTHLDYLQSVKGGIKSFAFVFGRNLLRK